MNAGCERLLCAFVAIARPCRVRMTSDACRRHDPHHGVCRRQRSGPQSPQQWSAKCTRSSAPRTPPTLGDDDECAASQAPSRRSPFYAAGGPHAWAGCRCAAEPHVRCMSRAGHHHLACLGACEREAAVQPCQCGSPPKPIAQRLRRVAYASELNTQ